MEAITPNFKIGIKNDIMSNDGKTVELYFLDYIYNKTSVNWLTGEETEESMLADVIEKVNNAKPNKIIQYIDSFGGSCSVGLGIYNYLKGHTAKVETKILNSCASIATVMAFAGNKGKITMPRNGVMIIHQAQSSAQGTAKDLRDEADITEFYTNNILDVYVQNNRKGKTKDELYDLIKDGDYWMTGTQACEMGFVDDCYNDDLITVTNSLAKAKLIYDKIPSNIQAIADLEGKPKKGKLLNKIKNLIDMKVEEMVAKFKSELPNAEVVAGKEINFATLLEVPIANMLNSINEAITNEIANATNSVTEIISNATAAIETKYKEIIDGLKTNVDNVVLENTENKKTITTLTADLRALAGKGSPASGNEDETTGNAKGGKTFAGRVKYTNVGTE